MKPITSKLIIASLVLTSVFFGASAFKNNKTQTNPTYITMRSIEIMNGMWASKIVILFEDGKTEEIELGKLSPKNLAENSKKIQDAINYVASKGYTLMSSGAGNGDAMVVNTFIFTKN